GLLTGGVWFTLQLEEARRKAESHASGEELLRKEADLKRAEAEKRKTEADQARGEADRQKALAEQRATALKDALGQVQEAERKSRAETARLAVFTGLAADDALDAGR